VDWSALVDSTLQGARESIWLRLVVSSVGGAVATLVAFGIQKLWRGRNLYSRLRRDAARALRDQGEQHAQLEHRHEAIELFDLSVQLNPDDPHAYYARGNLHAELGNPELALSDWRRCVALFPEHRDARRRILELGQKPHTRRSFGYLLWGGVGVLLLIVLVVAIA
jgi:tetratricopeptide (TPR) repeat protein